MVHSECGVLLVSRDKGAGELLWDDTCQANLNSEAPIRNFNEVLQRDLRFDVLGTSYPCMEMWVVLQLQVICPPWA